MKAALISLDWKTGETLSTIFTKEDGYENPVLNARGLKESIKHDFPDCDWTIIADEEASKFWGKYYADRLLGIEGEDE